MPFQPFDSHVLSRPPFPSELRARPFRGRRPALEDEIADAERVCAS